MSEHDSPSGTADAAKSGPGDSVTDLVAQCLLEIEDVGNDPTAQGAILDRFCDAHPNHATVIRRRIRLLGILRAAPESNDSADSPAFPSSQTDQFGDFRLVNVIAQGGMGVVYRAVQKPLGREVALKLIRPDHLYFPAARERFRREAEAVARMQHPAIVPVFTVGETQGLPWFAMELVRGCSASEAITELRTLSVDDLRGAALKAAIERVVARRDGDPDATAGVDVEPALFQGSWTQCCLAILRDVLSGLDHAHRRGVLHRDLKPSNLMLTSEGRVLLLDFGLALNIERGERTALTAGIIGSAPYMAPEQFEIERVVDERTDVYAAGVLLYELLTLRNPFLVGGAGTESLERRIREGTSPPIRSLMRGCDKDLEIVVAKAMAQDPAERYASASAFRIDIENLLAQRPVEARPLSSTARMWRIARLNPRATAAGLLAVVSAIALPSGLLWQERRSSQLIQSALDRAEAESGRAERNLLESLKTVRAMIETIGVDDVSRTPELRTARSKLIERARDLYDRFSADNRASRELAREIAMSRHEGAKLLTVVGEFDAALAEFDASKSQIWSLLERDPNDVVLLRRTVGLCVDQLSALWKQSRFDDAVAVGNDTLERVRRFPTSARLADDSDFAVSMARLQMNIALASMSKGAVEVAEQELGECVRRLEDIVSKGRTASAVMLLITARQNWEHARGRLKLPIVESAQETARLAREFADENPDDFARQTMFNLTLMGAAVALPADDPRAIPMLLEVIDRMDRSLDRAPDPVEVRYPRVNAKLILRFREAGFGNFDRAFALANEIIDELEELVPIRVAPDYVANNFSVLSSWVVSQERVDLTARVEFIERASLILEKYVAASKESRVFRESLDGVRCDAIELQIVRNELVGASTRLGEFELTCANKPRWDYWLACMHSRILERATLLGDSAATPLRNTSRERALECLKRAIANDQLSGSDIDGDRDFDPLRNDPLFLELRALAK